MRAPMPARNVETRITIRLSRQTCELIDSAAAAIGKTRAEFVIESARHRAVEVLPDQRIFYLDATESVALLRILDKPPTPLGTLRRLMTRKAPWEQRS